MNLTEEKCVIVVDESMEIGNIANVISILSISLGKLRPDIVGEDTKDADSNVHGGLIQVPVPLQKILFFTVWLLRETKRKSISLQEAWDYSVN